MDMKLSGKTVLITGGSRGIGFACAMGFAAEGCAVHIASRSKESLESAREKIRARHNVPVEIHPADFSNGETARSVVEAVGHADILVNNAGAIPQGDILSLTEPTWREAWDLKVFGYINATRAMLEKMYARKKGVVVNVIGLADGGIDYAMDDNNKSLVDDAMKAAVEKAKADIIAGTTQVHDFRTDNKCPY